MQYAGIWNIPQNMEYGIWRDEWWIYNRSLQSIIYICILFIYTTYIYLTLQQLTTYTMLQLRSLCVFVYLSVYYSFLRPILVEKSTKWGWQFHCSKNGIFLNGIFLPPTNTWPFAPFPKQSTYHLSPQVYNLQCLKLNTYCIVYLAIIFKFLIDWIWIWCLDWTPSRLPLYI